MKRAIFIDYSFVILVSMVESEQYVLVILLRVEMSWVLKGSTRGGSRTRAGEEGGGAGGRGRTGRGGCPKEGIRNEDGQLNDSPYNNNQDDIETEKYHDMITVLSRNFPEIKPENI